MSKPSTTRSGLPKSEQATERQLGFQAIAGDGVGAADRAVEERESVLDLTTALYQLFRESMAESGGADALRARLDERDSFKTDISRGVNRVNDGTGQRRVPLEWVAGVVVDSDGAYHLLAGLSRMLGYEPPVRQRLLTREQTADTALDVVSEMPETLKSGIRTAIAKRRGVRPEDVKL
jgi:hypothetical protein